MWTWLIGVAGVLVISVILSIPVLVAARREGRLTWTGAIVLGTLIMSVSLLLTAEVPSRILYAFSANHEAWATHYPFLGFLKGDAYLYVADIIANTVQGILFVVLVVAGYIWGEQHRKAGRFKS